MHDNGALDDLFWRDEILEAMYWLRGEGLASEVNAQGLAGFLAGDVAVVEAQMDRLAREGDLKREDERYRLTERGEREGAMRFRDTFRDMTRLAHGECIPGCWCHDPAHAGEPCPSHLGR